MAANDIERVRAMVARDDGLAVVATAGGDGRIQASVVNVGVCEHPLDGEPVAAFVAMGGSVKLRRLRSHPRITLVLRAGWQWVAVEGGAQLVGPDDPVPGVDGERVRLLLREIFTAAGGTHDDLGEYDRVMAAERRTAVLVRPERVYGSPG